MSSTSYYNSLSATAYDGTVGNIRLRWSAAGKDRVYALSQETGAPVETIKALTEHVVYASAHRLQNQQAVIRSPPHDFYLAGVGQGATAYDNVQMTGESVTKKKGGKSALDPNLSWGNYTTASFQNMSMTATSSASAHAGSNSSGATGQSDWVWYEEYQRWYHPGTQQWQ